MNVLAICGAANKSRGIAIFYHVSPGHDPNPENWVTEVCYPVRKR